MRYLSLIFFSIFTLTLSPVEAQISVNSRTAYLLRGAPGQAFKQNISLSNGSEKPSEARIYCSDYTFSADGSSDFPSPGSHPKSNCSWIHLSQNSITLPPKSSGEFGITLSVPNNPDLEGTYWGVVFVEPVTEKIVPPSQKNNTQTLHQNVRYGIQLIVEIGKTGHYSVKVVKHEVVKEKEKNFLQFDVENQGSRYVSSKVSLDLFTKEGKKVKEMKLPNKLIYPACSARFSFDITGMDPGDYSSFFLLDHSENAVFGGQYPFQIPKPEPEKEKKNNDTKV